MLLQRAMETGRQKRLTEIEKKLLFKMKNFLRQYEMMGLYCWEIFTLMSGYAIKNKIEYNFDIHQKLLNYEEKSIFGNRGKRFV